MKRDSMWPVLFIVGGIALVLFLVLRSPAVSPTSSSPASRDMEAIERHGAEAADFLESLNQELKEGVDPSANVEASLRNILGPSGIPEIIRGRYYQLLGIPLPTEEGNYFTPFVDFVRYAADMIPTELEQPPLQPWSAKDFPYRAQWLAKNNEHLDAVVAATNLSHMYVPLVNPSNSDADGPRLFGVLLPAAQQHRDLAEALMWRAMLRVHDEQLEAAWRDLQACHRLARHVSHGGTLIEALVAISIEMKACEGDRVLAQSPALTSALARSLIADLNKLPQMPGLERHLNRGERLRFIEGTLSMAKRGPSVLQELSRGASSNQNAGVLEQFLSSMVDWNEVLRIGNEYFDRIAEAAAAASPEERKALSDAVEQEIRALAGQRTPFGLLGSNRTQRSHYIAMAILNVCMPAISSTIRSRDAALTQMELTRLHLALVTYRADHGHFPDLLAALCPDYLAEVPIDPLTSGPFVYQSDGGGARLYSLGMNEQDDGGQPPGLIGGADDILVILP